MTFYGGRSMVFNLADFGAVPGIDSADMRKVNQRAIIRCIQAAKGNYMSAMYIPGSMPYYIENVDAIMSVAVTSELEEFNFLGDYYTSVVESRAKKLRVYNIWGTMGQFDRVIKNYTDLFTGLDSRVKTTESAITNLSTSVDQIEQQIGSGENLSGRVQTLEDEMNTAQTDINALKSSVASGKTAIASAITAKGVATASDSTFQTMANNIALIPSGSGVYTDDELVSVPDSRPFIGSEDFGTLPITYDGAFLTVKSNWYAFWQKIQGSTWNFTTSYSGGGTPDKFVLYIKDANGNTVDIVGFNVPDRGTNWSLNSGYLTAINSIFVDYTKRTFTISAFQNNGGSGNNYYAAKAIPAGFDMKTMKLCMWVQKNSPKATGSIGLTYQGRGIQTIT